MVTTLELTVSILVGIVAIILIEEALSAFIRRAARGAGANPTVIRDIGYSLRVIALLVILYVVTSLTGLSSEFTILTISGIGALAITLALQTTLSNIFSGILLFHDGAVHLNDVVEYGGVKGKVVRLALRNAWIKTDSGRIAVVSNSALAYGPLINHSATERLSKKYAIE